MCVGGRLRVSRCGAVENIGRIHSQRDGPNAAMRCRWSSDGSRPGRCGRRCGAGRRYVCGWRRLGQLCLLFRCTAQKPGDRAASVGVTEIRLGGRSNPCGRGRLRSRSRRRSRSWRGLRCRRRGNLRRRT
jgi:hypothetical protein